MEHMANLLNILPEANKLVSSAVSNPVVSSAKPDMFLHEVHPAPLISNMSTGGFKLREEYGSFPIGSMYDIYGNIYHQYTPNVSIYTIHGSCGFWTIITQILLMEEIWKPVNNASFLLLELPPSPPKRKDWCGTSVFFWLVTIGFLIVVIEKQ